MEWGIEICEMVRAMFARMPLIRIVNRRQFTNEIVVIGKLRIIHTKNMREAMNAAIAETEQW
jgi:hypothetical protein